MCTKFDYEGVYRLSHYNKENVYQVLRMTATKVPVVVENRLDSNHHRGRSKGNECAHSFNLQSPDSWSLILLGGIGYLLYRQLMRQVGDFLSFRVVKVSL